MTWITIKMKQLPRPRESQGHYFPAGWWWEMDDMIPYINNLKRRFIYLILISFAIGFLGATLLFNKIIQSEHNSNRSLYNTLNKCDQSLKKVLNGI